MKLRAHLRLGLADPAVALGSGGPELLLKDGEDALDAQAHPHSRHLLAAEHAHQVVVPAVQDPKFQAY